MNRLGAVLVLTVFAVLSGACSSNGGNHVAMSAPAVEDGKTRIPDPGARVRALDNETVGVACGVCIYGMEGGDDCPLAAEIGEGKYYFVTLKLKGEFDTHGVGLCDAASKARVTGDLHEHGVVATAIELLPEK